MPLIGITGLPGAGKTYFAVRSLYSLRRRDPERLIVSNTELYLPGRPVPVVESLEECFPLTDCDILLDELHLWLASRMWNRNGQAVAQWLSQLRKRRVNVIYTTQDLSSVDKFVRDRTFLSYYVESWRKLGFFRFNAFFGVKADAKQVYMRGWYLFNEKVASCYRHEREVLV